MRLESTESLTLKIEATGSQTKQIGLFNEM